MEEQWVGVERWCNKFASLDVYIHGDFCIALCSLDTKHKYTENLPEKVAPEMQTLGYSTLNPLMI